MALSTASAVADHVRRSKEPHSVDQPDQALLINPKRELVLSISVQQQVRCAHNEVSIDGLPPRNLTATR